MIATNPVNVMMVMCQIVLMTIAVQRVGLVMALQTVKIRLMAVISPAMTWTVVTVQILTVVTVFVTVVKPKQTVRKTAVQVVTVQTVNLIGQPTDLNAAIQHGVSMVLIALHLKVHMAGIVPVVTAQVMPQVNVVMVLAIVMKIAIAALPTVVTVANVTQAI
jgi:hypothetical protein